MTDVGPQYRAPPSLIDTLATDAIARPAHNISHYLHSGQTTSNTSYKRQISHSITLDINGEENYVATDKEWGAGSAIGVPQAGKSIIFSPTTAIESFKKVPT